MKAPEIADTDDCCSDFFHHEGIMPRLAAKESARWSLYPVFAACFMSSLGLAAN